jgi:hypothetical protein
MPAALPAHQRRDKHRSIRLTAARAAALERAALREGTTVTALIEDALAAAGHLPAAPR